MSPIRERLVATAFEYIREYNNFDPNTLLTIRTPTCVIHGIAPSYRFSQNNEEYAEHLKSSRGIFKSVNARIVDKGNIIVDESTRKVALNLAIKCETTVGLYENEFICILLMNEEGSLVDASLQFMDTLCFQRFQEKLKTT